MGGAEAKPVLQAALADDFGGSLLKNPGSLPRKNRIVPEGIAANTAQACSSNSPLISTAMP